MTERVNLPHGVLQQNDHEVVVEIPLSFTKIQEQEQLSELAKSDPIFLSCASQEIRSGQIYLVYDLPKGYKPLQSWDQADTKTKRIIAKNILAIKSIQGTQFTTYIHPNNIYCNREGNVKFVYRGIRSVLPPEQDDGKEFVFQIKCLILAFFTGRPFIEFMNKTLTDIPVDQPFVEDLGKAKSLSEIEAILTHDIEIKAVDRSIQQNKKEIIKPPVDRQPKKEPVLSANSNVKNRNERSNSKWIYSAIFLIIGIIIGGVATYNIQVLPHSNALASSNHDKVELQNELEEVINAKESQEEILSGYKLIVAGERDKAIELFSGIDQLSTEEEKVLAKQYVEQNTPESLSRAAMIDPELHPLIAEKLVLLNSKEANEALASLQSDSLNVQIEQSWMNKDYENVISIYSEHLTDTTRAKTLAANSYFQIGKLKEAKKLAVEISDTSLQIKIINEEIKSIEKDKKKSKKQKTEEIKKKNEEIKKLK